MTGDQTKAFLRSFQDARRNVVEMARTMPELFPEWHTLNQAKQELEDATGRYERALAHWNRVAGIEPVSAARTVRPITKSES